MSIQTKKIKAFKKIVWDFYTSQGRHDLPWRKTHNPYHIAVSEIMLQQTQVPRVLEKYSLFLKQFPTLKKLAAANLKDVIALWSGLGYNRRAKFLYLLAKVIVGRHKNTLPHTVSELEKLPGIGPYTARAIVIFAYNMPEACIETNIRTVFIHHFFRTKEKVSDAEILKLISRTVDVEHPREWYWALMDYGSFLKQTGNKVHQKSAQYTKQSTFIGSRRQVRGKILKTLLIAPVTLSVLSKKLEAEKDVVRSVLKDLQQEGFILKKKNTYTIL